MAHQLPVPAHIGRHHQPALGHGFQGLQGGHQVRQAHGQARVGEDIHQVVVVLHLLVGYPAGEHDGFLQAQARDGLPDHCFLGPAAHQQQAQRRVLTQQGGQGLQQQGNAFVGIEGADKAEHGLALEPQLLLQIGFGRGAIGKAVRVHRIGDDGDFPGGDAATGDLRPQALADGGDGIRAPEDPGFHGPGQAIARAALAAGAVVHRGVFPEGPALVHHRQAESAPGAQGSQAVQSRRVGVEDSWLLNGYNFFNAPGQGAHHLPLVHYRQAEQGIAAGCRAVEVQTIHRFLCLGAGTLLEPGNVGGVPAQGALLAQDIGAAEGVAAVQGMEWSKTWRMRMTEWVTQPP